jgi:hypothetical protein
MSDGVNDGNGEQPEIPYPELVVGARVMLCAVTDDFAQTGTIEKIDGDLVTVDFYDWSHEYHTTDIKPEFFCNSFELVVYRNSGRILKTYGLI